MAYGLTADGFIPKTLEIILAEVKADIVEDTGVAEQYLGDEETLGQVLGIVCERIAEVWEVAEDVNSGSDPDAATGVAQEQLCALTGTLKRAATRSTVTLTLTGTPATEVLEGSQATGSTATFETTEDVTLATLTAWAMATAYVVGDRVTNASRAYQCITAGTSAGAGGPTTTDEDITDNTAHWIYLGEGAGAADGAARATETGPLVAVAGDVDTIETPVSGWSSVINLLDADEGQNVETDEELRIRREDELGGDGLAVPDAIREVVLEVTDVTRCTVFYNDTDATDGDGVPAHSVEVLVVGGTDAAVAAGVFAAVGGGIRTHGTESATVTDSEGTEHTIAFSRLEEVEIYVETTLVKNPLTYPTDGDAQVKLAIVAWGDARDGGHNAYASAIGAQAFEVTGVLDVTETLIDDAPAPAASTTVAISTRQVAVYDTSRITVNSSDGTP
jgi:hypothetical protein